MRMDKLYRDHLLAVPQTSISTAQNAPGRTVFLGLGHVL